MFTQKMLEFLFENRMQNNRSWFEEHKAEYQKYVYEPLQQMVAALTPTMLEIDDKVITQPRVDKTISRIWRDTRYSHDKSFYRDSMWIIFKRGKMHATEVPGLYFEIGCDGVNYGCGFYHASTEYMQSLRDRILAKDPLYRKANTAYQNQKVFTMQGDCYKRPRYAQYDAQDQLWLERRNICFIAEKDDADFAFSKELPEKLMEDFKLLKPIYHFLLDIALEVQIQETAGNLVWRG